MRIGSVSAMMITIVSVCWIVIISVVVQHIAIALAASRKQVSAYYRAASAAGMRISACGCEAEKIALQQARVKLVLQAFVG